MTSFTFSLVIATGTSSTEGTSVTPLFTEPVAVEASSPFRSAIASSVTYLTPVVAVLVGWIFLGEKITWNEPIGALIVIFGAALAQGRFKSSKQLA